MQLSGQFDWKKTIYSDESKQFVSNPLPAFNESITLSLRLAQSVPVQAAFLIYAPRGDKTSKAMHPIKTAGFFQSYAVTVQVTEAVFAYCFHLIINAREYYYTRYGLFDYQPGDHDCFTLFSEAQFSSWTPRAVFYQIIPDRFFRQKQTALDQRAFMIYRGKHKKAIRGQRMLADWQDPAVAFTYENPVIQYYGGNLSGIQAKIDYLKNLGINALYLTPVFSSRSNHRYDVEDYFKIDPLLGDETDLEQLVKQIHARKMHLLFDAVLNHSGLFCRWFDHLNEHGNPGGAYQDPNSPYADFYYLKPDRDDFVRWRTFRNLPKLKLENKKLRQILIQAPHSFLKKWLKPPFLIDGWRFDTADILGKFPYSRFDQILMTEIYQAVKSVNPEAYLLAESFYDPACLAGRGRYEGVMNYQGFWRPVLKWLCRLHNPKINPTSEQQFLIEYTARQMAAQLKSVRCSMSYQNQIRMYNLLGSHDTRRIATVLQQDFSLLKIAYTLLFTYIGIPAIYYGDELGMSGGANPGCRQPMDWQAVEKGLPISNLCQTLIQLRQEQPVLIDGSYLDLYADQDLFCFARFNSDQIMITLCSRACRPLKVNLDLTPLGIKQGEFKGFYRARSYQVQQYHLTIGLESRDCEILIYQA